MPQTIDLINFPFGEDVTQWPKLTCTQPGQLELQDAGLRLPGSRDILFQDNGQIRSFDNTHRLVFDRTGGLLELHEAGAIRFLTGSPTPTEKLRILATGQVGIGTATPTSLLHVTGDIRTDGALRVAGPAAVGGTLTVGSTVGIGTATPTQPLEVVGTVKATAFQGDGAGLTGVRGTDDTKVLKGGDTMSGALAITAAGTGLRVTHNVVVGGALTVEGNVGIGTTSPQEKLDVNGLIKAGSLSIGPWPHNRNYLFFGANTLNQTQQGNYALLQGSGAEAGRTFLNSPVDIRFRINNADQLVLNPLGLFGSATGPGNVRLRIAVGRTQPNQWIQYGNNGIYVDVSTASAGFTQTPYYFTSLLGNTNHWLVRGSSSIYNTSPNGFQIYLYYEGITVSIANAWGWYINWVAIGL
jgi:hypothetical protein